MQGSAQASSRKNCFDLIRLILTLGVIEQHLNLYGGYGVEWLIRSTKDHASTGELAVLGFFGLSGYLISTSCAKLINEPGGWARFISRRFLRIMPGFWVCLILTATVIAPLLVTLYHRSLQSYDFFGARGGWDYIRNNWWLVIRQYDLGDVLRDAPYGAIDGNLWSLLPEVVCYGATLGLAWLGLFRDNRWMAPAVLALLTALNVIHLGNQDILFGPTAIVLNSWYLYLGAYFTGMTLYCYKEEFPVRDWRKAVFAGFFMLFMLKFGGTMLGAPLLVPLLLLSVGELFVFPLRHDLSYGIYIYGSPALQIAAAIMVIRNHYILYTLSSLALAAGMAFLSWILVERPCISFGHRKRPVNKMP
ncbi:MAG TPA: acyltransferase [Opitutaceae bacterium]|jgi:peptidoglycan/LPS O-acetylase OafA/YrhL|nr:acyltransferase [Opitutaceae bacterium]